MPRQRVGDIEIYYEVHGAGPRTLVMIRGLGSNLLSWYEQIDEFSRHYKCVVFDNRGAGRTDKPDAPYSIKQMADDTAGLMDALGITRAALLGISMGGMIAQEFALKHASRVRGLVLGCTACGMQHSAPNDPENVAKLMPDPKLSAEEQARRAFSVACGTAFLNSKHGQDFINQQIADMGKYPVTPMHTYARQFGAIQGWDSYEQLGQIKAPTMIIHGDDDRLLPHANADILHKQIPGSKVHILKGIGHMFFWEAPEESVRVPADFVASAK